MTDYQSNRTIGDRHMDQIKGIVGRQLLSVGTFEEDTKENTDLKVLVTGSKRIACRVRQYSQIRYRDEFTIRSWNKGHKTELQKVLEGWGDWMFYGFETEDKSKILCCRILDLEVFRKQFPFIVGNNGMKSQANGDGTKFSPFRVDDFTKDFVVAEHGFKNVVIDQTSHKLAAVKLVGRSAALPLWCDDEQLAGGVDDVHRR